MFDRGWAVGLSQVDFEREWARRFPMADVIPSVDDYARGSEPTYHGIDPINPESLLFDDKSQGEKPEEKTEIKALKEYHCRGCGKMFNYPVARARHEKSCKAILVAK